MDSDSDWDSLPGDPELPSEYKTTPSIPHPPAPPTANNTSTPIKKAVKTSSKTSIPSSAHSTDSSTNHKPNQMYGKTGGVTAFVDRSNHSIRTLNDNKKSSGESIVRVDSNSNAVLSGSVDKRNKTTTQALELNELDFNPVKDTGPAGQTNEGFHSTEVPPYTNFKDALPANDVKESKKPEQKKGKTKSAYIRAKTPENLDDHTPTSSPRNEPDNNNYYWEVDEQEDRQYQHAQLAITTGKDKPAAVDSQGHIVDVFVNDGNFCVPYQKTNGTGYTYMFNHGKSKYLNVVPEWREPFMKTLGERSERWLTYFWQEVFGAIALIVDFGLIFLLELMRFIFRKVLLRLLVGFVVVIGDHLLKPVLAAIFNSILQPTLTFLWNALLGVKNGIKPLLDITREIILQITTLLKGFRLFELNWKPTFANGGNNSQTLSSQFAHRQQIQEI